MNAPPSNWNEQKDARDRSRFSTPRPYRALTWCWAALIAVLLLLPGSNLPDPKLPDAVEVAIELGVHLVAFMVLALLATWGYGAQRPSGDRSRIAFSAILAYCVLLEIFQIPVPGRGFEFVDIGFGWLGALLGFRGRR